ncbi:MAG TPA: menaquinone biosynthesis protein, partial [Vicinamibacterales bacterium]|nr:menaquinone biosynthesis protein [Vicinamibacterales bacterium]
LIPSIEYLRGGPFAIVPDIAIASRGPVTSVMLYTKRPIEDVRSIAIDTSSRTSVALVRVLCDKLFRIDARFEPIGPNLETMLAAHDAALLIGDPALFQPPVTSVQSAVEVVDLGETWFRMTGLPFVYAFWAGRPGVLTAAHIEELQRTRDRGLANAEIVVREYLHDSPARQAVGRRYLRDNIKYYLGDDERAGLELFYRYAADIGVAPQGSLRFYEPESRP